MAAIALRSPQYKSLVAGANSVYALCTIKIGGVLKYTLRKEVAPSETVVFEISELCRDFLNITFDGTYTAQTLTIQTEIIAYNSSGGLVNSTGDIDDIGYDAYGTFMEVQIQQYLLEVYLIHYSQENLIHLLKEIFMYHMVMQV